MRNSILLFGSAVLGCLIVASWPIVAAQDAAPASASIPSFDQISETVNQYYEKIPGNRPGDLITQKEVEPLLKQLEKQGLPLDAKKILAKTPANNEFLVRILSTPDGRCFMRSIATYPNGYDCVDRLTRLPHGRETIRTLVSGPQGERMIEYMTMTQGGQAMGKMLSKAPNGANFNAPTGRLYTVSLLLEELQKYREAALKAAEEKDGD
jgi:hypothetical protein